MARSAAHDQGATLDYCLDMLHQVAVLLETRADQPALAFTIRLAVQANQSQTRPDDRSSFAMPPASAG